VTIIIPFAAGRPIFFSRLIGEHMDGTLGQQFVSISGHHPHPKLLKGYSSQGFSQCRSRKDCAMKRAFGLMLLLLPLLCTLAKADGVGNFCPHWPWEDGTCVIDNPVYVNVYWEASPAQWDTKVGSSLDPSTGVLVNSGMTQGRIDGVSTALVNSGYFGQLAQYKVWSVNRRGVPTPIGELSY
jgi:hypothetical protein